MTRNTSTGPTGYCDWNEYNLKTLMRNDWRASLVPAAAVIPAPIVYIKVAAVKKLVVGFRINENLRSIISMCTLFSFPSF
ncbi:MAG: hypothetical protein JWR38_5899 [Mucilaginibacter sp.]|nr:hypothetical protein [Mucilaginibacter sp.]